MAIITLNNNSLSSVTSLPAAIATGKVLQVQTASTQTQVNSTSGTHADTGLTCNITPSSTSNKVLIIINQVFAKNNLTILLMLKCLEIAQTFQVLEEEAYVILEIVIIFIQVYHLVTLKKIIQTLHHK